MPWSKEVALREIRSIFYDILNKFDPNKFWSAHPNDDSDLKFNKSLYLGASGTLWGLLEISKFLEKELSFNPILLSEKIHQAYLIEPDTGSVIPSYLAGESGILLLQYKLTQDKQIKESLIKLIKRNFENPCNDLLFGHAGTLLVSLYLDESDLFKLGAQKLLDTWFEYNNQWIWEQVYDGYKTQYVGASHGFFGNIFPLLKGKEFLSPLQNELILERIITTTCKSVIRENGKANWPARFNTTDEAMRLQWCHGAVGVITSFHHFPLNYSKEIETLLIEAGQLIWESGPLKKGIGICHGTDGNGYALLNLYYRTNDRIWLERARDFAMKAIQQRNGRSSLWTGEIGLALYLMACIEETPNFPCLDYF